MLVVLANSMRLAVFGWILTTAITANADEPLRLHVEADPLPFVQSGYGVQVGARGAVLGRTRVALASFSLDVPDFAAELGGNDGWGIRVRPSTAVYVLHYLRSGIIVGGSVRVLRLRYSHDDVGGHIDTVELSPEVITGYYWRPTRYSFYVQPWFGLSTMVWRSDEARVGDRVYDALPVQAFFTVNLGWELVL